jgi:dipeptidyl aminopeptidase/acylaminoacyl peptidase
MSIAASIGPALSQLGLMIGAAALPAPSNPSVHDLVHVTDISGLAASPDGKKIAFRTERAEAASNTYPAEWYVVELGSGSIRAVGSGGAAIHVDPGVAAVEIPIWSADAASIFYRAQRDGEVQLWRARADGTAAGPVVTEEADIVSLRPGEHGNSLIFSTGPSRDSIRRAEAAEYDSGILVDQHVDPAQNIHRGAIINGRHATQRLTGRWFERAGLLWREPLRERSLDMSSLAVGEAQSPRNEEAQVGDVSSRSASGDLAIASWSNQRGSLEVRRSGGGRTIRCLAPECARRIAWLAWRPGHDQILFAAQDEALWQSLFLWDVRSGAARLVVRGEGLLSGGRDPYLPCAVTRDDAVCVAAAAASPPRLERIGLEDGARSTLFDPNDKLRPRIGVTAERLEWRGSDGLVHTGMLLSPTDRSADRLPLFVTYYRCEGFLRGGVGDEWPLAPLARTGILSLCINRTPLAGAQDSLAQNRAAAAAVSSIVRSLDASGRIDRTRVGMGGLSFGSEVTMWVAYNSDLLAAASISSPALEPTYYWVHGVSGRDNHEKLFQAWRLGDPEKTRDRWKLLSAALNVERIKAPILMQLPEQEARVIPELHARLTHSAAPAELYVFPDEPHIKFLPRHKLAAYQRNLDWFRFWLQGHVDPDPLKTSQYERWILLDARRSAAQADAQERRQSSRVARSKTRK